VLSRLLAPVMACTHLSNRQTTCRRPRAKGRHRLHSAESGARRKCSTAGEREEGRLSETLTNFLPQAAQGMASAATVMSNKAIFRWRDRTAA
jgi:hypothetical protein